MKTWLIFCLYVACLWVLGRNISDFLLCVLACYNYRPCTWILYLVKLMRWWIDDINMQLKANGESSVLRASWPIHSSYKRKVWTISRGAWARMPLHAMVPWKSTFWSSLSSVTAIGYSLWDQDKGLLLSDTSIITRTLCHCMLINHHDYFLFGIL